MSATDDSNSVLEYRIGQAEKAIVEERERAQKAEEKNEEELGKVRVALYALSGTTIGSCLILVIGQLLLTRPPT
jgi:hypothetical protein